MSLLLYAVSEIASICKDGIYMSKLINEEASEKVQENLDKIVKIASDSVPYDFQRWHYCHLTYFALRSSTIYT